MTKILTNSIFWESYWRNRKFEKSKKMFFSDLLYLLPSNSRLIEIGGFPGQYAAYLKRVLNCDITILDFYINPEKISEIENINNLESGSIKYIKGDFLTTEIKDKYQIVCSFGFIEHFINSHELIKKHIDCLEQKGIIFLTIPNFTGLNGLIQKKFDFENYSKHNIDCMNIEKLDLILKDLKLVNIKVEFFGSPAIWLEEGAKINKILRYLICNLLNKFISLLPIKMSKFFSPYILIFGVKIE